MILISIVKEVLHILKTTRPVEGMVLLAVWNCVVCVVCWAEDSVGGQK